MASLRAHLYAAMVRLGMRARIGRAPDIALIRNLLGRDRFTPPSGVDFVPGSLGGVAGEWVRAREARSERPRLLYVHGGGFVACSARMYRPITGHFALSGFEVFAPDYRLAPEHPFPAGLEDVLRAWAAFSAGGPAAIGGDSAGGNLAIGVMTQARGRGLPMPAAAALFSPSTDLLGRGGSYRENARRDALFNPEALVCFFPAYMNGADPFDPRASPIEADLTGLPPLLIHAAEREMMRDDSVRFAERARAMGVRVELSVWPVVPHAWQLAESFLPEARRSLDEAAAFLRRELSRNAQETAAEQAP